jgi:3-hydroxybutyryl-CoA dehydrogenase
MADIERVGVIGSGLMGSGIAEVCAKAGLDVLVREIDASAAEAGLARLTASFDRGVRSGKLEETARDTAMKRIRFTTDLADMADRELVIEAAIEDEALKTDIFRMLDAVVTSPTALLASNTSSIPITRLGAVTARPENVIGMHFFNPVPVLRLCELVSGARTSQESLDRAASFATERLGKTVIRSKDQAGFIVNALLVPYLLAAMRMYASGFASAEDIDAGMVEGCAHPMGPLRLSDLIGLDTMLFVANCLYEEFKEPLYAPPTVLLRMVEAGLLGRKSKQGFYSY